MTELQAVALYAGLNFYADGMLQHDDHVGQLLNTLDELEIADNTIVIYTSDQGFFLGEPVPGSEFAQHWLSKAKVIDQEVIDQVS